MPKLAILLAVHNGHEWLRVQIDSILKQVNVNITIFISVDESAANSTEIYQSLIPKADNIIFLPSVGRMGDAAKNFFRLIHDVNLVDFDYLAFSDQDDIWNNDKLDIAIAHLKSSGCDAYSSNVTAFWSTGKLREIHKSQPQVQWDYLFESAGPGCTFVLIKPLALKLQSFIQNHQIEMQSVWMHDWFIYAFARAQGYRWTINPQSTMLYRQHDSNQVGVNSGFKAIMHRASFVMSGKALAQSVIIAKLVGEADSAFTKSWFPFSRIGFIKLAFKMRYCRRKKNEQLLFFCACLLLAIKGV